FGVSLSVVTATGLTGLWVTGVGVVLILAAGMLLGRLGGITGDIRVLVSSGTAICGGSAIAAVSPILGARREAISVALAVVFVLNGLALYVFPLAGGALELTQREFALWAAIAIHDTSSVIGAASVYGAEALEHATVLKLARALWIIPLVVGLAGWMQWRNRDGSREQAIRWPWFIALFVLAAAARSAFPGMASGFELVSDAARQLMVLVLFLIGSGMSVAALRSIGWRPLAYAGVLWLIVSLAALVLARSGWNPVAG
ncbi:MAG: YeiH family protein, partial [Candidatus Wenzhouxiangella sp. M2_3B_020]